MLLLLGCPLPDFSEPVLAKFCLELENELAGSLDERQKIHIRKFARAGAPLRALAGRLLARKMLMANIGPLTLRMDRCGRPAASRMAAISFSHTIKAAFCAVSSQRRVRFAIDAEFADFNNPFFRNSPRANLRQLKNWLSLEACAKALANGWRDLRQAEAKKFVQGHFILPQDMQLRFFAMPGHMLCVAMDCRVPRKPLIRWYPHIFGLAQLSR